MKREPPGYPWLRSPTLLTIYEQRQDGQLEPIYNGFGLIQVITLKTYLVGRTIETGGDWSSGRSVLAVLCDDNAVHVQIICDKNSYKVHTISFLTFFVWTFNIVVDSWKFSRLLLYILWDDWIISMISGSNQQLQQQLEYTLLKPDCHSWSISKMQSGREDTLEERYGKNATETYRMLQSAFRPSWMNQASVFEWHKRFKEGRESVRDDERCARS